MPTTRALSLLRLLRFLVMGVVLALPLACWQVGSNVSAVEPTRAELVVAGALLECPVGSEGCPCTAGGGCDPGLTCMSGICGWGGDGGGEYEYEFDENLAPPAPAPARTIEARSTSVDVVSRSAGRKLGRAEKSAKSKNKRNSDHDYAKDASSPAAEMGPVAPKPVPTIGAETTTTPSGEPESATELDEGEDRQMIYTATLQVAVYELDAAIEFAESLPLRYGGWIESRYDYQITLRLPAERLFEAMDQLGALGQVLGKTLRADDVTDEYTDLESRILVLEQLVEQLELLLAKATSVEEALKIRVELDRVRIELEAARVRMRSLSELIDFSTLTLYLSKRGPVDALPSSNDPFPWVDDLGVETTEYR